ncbi:branched-chain amino acid ABC transporter permease [Jatrophihabitans telluris]|uniref:Branched-chain amino acid ABC transporter permease n=1 Tax=Jatrophihabitans telluris TaxID=2038343 RepID=A0ABY4R0V4_9ACTN|nr:branched-chain amino acid ABC transporter permease [Jatrophihabitans telluris]UQX88962.1 branched-chain amino acid ABC transporter permease [Jatrophihabitans telluris]
MHALILGIGFGIVTAAVLAISTVALSLQFSVTNFPNFSHGEFMTIGAYSSYSAYQATHSAIVACVVAMAVGAILGVGVNMLLLAPFGRKNTASLTLFVVTIGLSLILQNAVLWRYGGSSLRLQIEPGLPHHILGFELTTAQLIIIGGAVLSMAGVHVLLKYTVFGRAQRAVAESPMLAEASGIKSGRVINLTWLLTGALTGLAGFVLALTTGSLTPVMGFSFLLVVFASAILGGIGHPYGSMAGAVAVGLAMEVSATYIPSDYKTVVAFVILIAVLLVRPQGLVPSKRLAAA